MQLKQDSSSESALNFFGDGQSWKPFSALLVSKGWSGLISSWCSATVFLLSLFTIVLAGSSSQSGKRIELTAQDLYHASQTRIGSDANTGCLLTLSTTISSDALRERLSEVSMLDARLRSSLVFPLVDGIASADHPPYFQPIQQQDFRVPLHVADPLPAVKYALNQAIAQAMTNSTSEYQYGVDSTLCYNNLWWATYWPGRSASQPSHLLLRLSHVLTDGLGLMRFIEKHLLQDIGRYQPPWSQPLPTELGNRAEPLEDASDDLVRRFPTRRRDGMSERSISLDDIRTVREYFGAGTTVTDVLLACAGEALAKYKHSDDLRDLMGRTSVPIGVPLNWRDSDDSSLSNQVGGRHPTPEVCVETYFVNAVSRLRDILSQEWEKLPMQEDGHLQAYRISTDMFGLPLTVDQHNRLLTWDRSISLSNAPGPKKPKTLCGSDVVSVHKIGHGGTKRGTLTIGTTSYLGQLQIAVSFHSDPYFKHETPIGPHVAQDIVDSFIKAFDELLEFAIHAPPRHGFRFPKA